MTDYNMPLGATIKDYEDQFQDELRLCPECFEYEFKVSYEDKYYTQGYCYNCKSTVSYDILP